jgi:flagellar hook-basal body complex protein FliE
MALPPIPVSPTVATQAYQAADASASPATGAATDFGDVLARALDGVVQAGHAADAQSTAAISGGGNITDVVTAVSKAELALQTAAAIRDRVVQAYQDIMRMPI